MSNTVVIDPVRLHKVCRTCLCNIRDYQWEQSTFTIERKFVWYKLSVVEYKLWTHPSWVTKDAGVVTRLRGLMSVAENALGSDTVQLSLITYEQLFKLLNKDSSFEPYVFGMGY